MYILDKTGNVLINSDHVANFYISGTPLWSIRAEYPMPHPNDECAFYDIVASYDSEEQCRCNFNYLIHALIEDRKFFNFLKEEY